MLQFAYDLRHELWLCYEEVCLSDTVVLSDIRLPLNYDKKAVLTAKYCEVEIVIVFIHRVLIRTK